MKKSNIEWVGEIPNNWNIIKGKYFIDYIVRKVRDDDDIITCFRDGEVTLRKNRREEGFTISEKEIGYQGINPGDLIVHGMDGFAGAIGISDSKGKASPVLNVLDTKENKRYIMYYLRMMAYYGVFESLSTGIRVRTCDTNWQKIRELPFIIPPKDIQDKIVNYLDCKVSSINKIKQNLKYEIDCLNNYKEKFIEDTITLGLNNDKIIESKYAWIDKVSEKLKLIPLKLILEDGKDSIKAGPFGSQLAGSDFLKETSDYWVYNQRSVIDKNFSEGNAYISESKYDTMKGFQVHANDILVTTRGTIGKICRVPHSFNKGIIHPCIIKFRIDNEKYNYNLLEYIFNESIFVDKQIRYKSNSTTIEVIYSDTLKNILLPNWSLDEQNLIVKYLKENCDNMNKIINNKKKQLEILEEYKKSLIYEYVTGKKEVETNTIVKTNVKGIKVNCKDNIFAQAILLCKVIEKLNKYNLGRVKAEKTLYLIEKDIGFDFDNNYVREAAGPLSESIYKCESVISKKNKWIKVNKVKKHIEYEILSDFSKYSKYYDKYYSNYDNQIEEIIKKVKNYSTDKSEMVATLYASWNDFIIKKEDITDIKIVKDVRENWNDTKKRFNEQKWLDVLEEMKEIELTPKGNGNLTIIKEN